MTDQKLTLDTIFQYIYEGESIGFHGDSFGTKVIKKNAKRYPFLTIEEIAKQLEIIKQNAYYGMTNKELFAHKNWKDFPDPEMLEIIPQQVPCVPVYYKVHRVEKTI